MKGSSTPTKSAADARHEKNLGAWWTERPVVTNPVHLSLYEIYRQTLITVEPEGDPLTRMSYLLGYVNAAMDAQASADRTLWEALEKLVFFIQREKLADMDSRLKEALKRGELILQQVVMEEK